MPLEDFRIKTDFIANPKRKKLQRKLGADGVLALIDLWTNLTITSPKGFIGKTKEDIEVQSNWQGECGLLADTLLTDGTRFVDQKEDGFYAHDWEINQPWVFNYDKRQEIARENAKKRPVSKVLASGSQIADQSVSQVSAPTPSPSPSPVPSPSPSIDVNTELPNGNSLSDKSDAKPKKRSVFDFPCERTKRLWEAYPAERRGGRTDFFKQFKKINPDNETFEIIMSNLEKWKACGQWKDLTKAKLLPSWLNSGQCFNDCPPNWNDTTQKPANDFVHMDRDRTEEEYIADLEKHGVKYTLGASRKSDGSEK